MVKASLIISLIGLGIAVIGIPITLDQMGVINLGGEKSEVSLNLLGAVGDEASFSISNSKGGIAYVDRIEMSTNNFVKSPSCKTVGTAAQRTPINVFETLSLKTQPAIYNLEKYRTEENEEGKVSTGLHYTQNDLDKFVVPFSLKDTNGNIVRETYTFDLKFKILWCDLNDCNKKSIETETKNVKYVGWCEKIDTKPIIKQKQGSIVAIP